MAIKFQLQTTGRKASSTSAGETRSASPIASRGSDIAKIEFIRQASNLKDDDEKRPSDTELLLAAWTSSPERTVIALSKAGYSSTQIAEFFGYKNDEQKREFNSLLNAARLLVRQEIAADLIAKIEETQVPYQDADGIERVVDITSKLKKAATAALFGKTDEVAVSIAHGYRAKTTLSDVFSMSVEEIRKKKATFLNEYGRIFRTRDTDGHLTTRSLPPALAAIVKVAPPKTEESAPAAE